MDLVRYVVLVSLLLGPSFAVAARPRVVVAPIAADRGGALARQLEAALRDRVELAPASAAITRRKTDLAKARRNGVSGVVRGAITGKAPGRMLWLALLTRSTEPDRTWTLEVNERGLVATRAAEAVAREIERRLAPPGSTPRAAAPRPPAAPPPRAAAAPPPRAPAPPPPRAAAVPAPPPPAPPDEALAAAPPRRAAEVLLPVRPPPVQPREEEVASAPPPHRGAVELGAWVTGRELGYAGTDPSGTGTLQTMTADAVVCPRVYVEVFPAAAFGPGPLAGLGAFADYRRSVGFEVTAAAQDHAARLSRLSAGLTFRLPPLAGLRLAPAASYERLDVVVSGAIAGLPDARLAGVKVGAGLGFPIGSRLTLLAGGGWVRWTSARDLVEGDVPFFPSGSASALEAEAGLALVLSGRFSVRLLGEYSSTRYSLDADTTGTYRASRATDRFVGGRAAIRADL